MAKRTEEQSSGGFADVLDDLPTDELKDQARELMSALGEHAMAVATEKVGDLTGRLAGFVEHGGRNGSGEDGKDSGDSPAKHLLKAGVSGVKGMIMDKVGGSGSGNGKGGKSGKAKTTNIIEQIEVGVPVRVAYDVWTQFQDFPKFAKKIEGVEQRSDEKISWKAGIYFSHRRWESTIVEQVPDERIVWRSQGDKGHVDGTVTFHETAPNLTKILLVLEYHPQGLFERTGNAFRSQRRRARLELQRFDHHIMRQTILEQDEVEGWRGEIRDGEVVRSHEDALEDEESEDAYAEDEEESPEDEDVEYRDEESEDDEDAEDGEDDEYRDEDQDEDDDEYEDDEGDEDDEYEDEYEDDDEYEDEPDDEPEDEPEDDVSDQDGGRRSSRGRRREPAMSR